MKNNEEQERIMQQHAMEGKFGNCKPLLSDEELSDEELDELAAREFFLSEEEFINKNQNKFFGPLFSSLSRFLHL